MLKRVLVRIFDGMLLEILHFLYTTGRNQPLSQILDSGIHLDVVLIQGEDTPSNISDDSSNLQLFARYGLPNFAHF
jgi:hypothetical protein